MLRIQCLDIDSESESTWDRIDRVVENVPSGFGMIFQSFATSSIILVVGIKNQNTEFVLSDRAPQHDFDQVTFSSSSSRWDQNMMSKKVVSIQAYGNINDLGTASDLSNVDWVDWLV